MVTLQRVSRIQKLEARIRRELYTFKSEYIAEEVQPVSKNRRLIINLGTLE